MKTVCPKCFSESVIRIIYGYPTPEAIEKAEAGQIALGGCEVDNANPDWECKKCRNRWTENFNKLSA